MSMRKSGTDSTGGESEEGVYLRRIYLRILFWFLVFQIGFDGSLLWHVLARGR
jgi:hypothetical protein